jgi:hypothetical protein
MRPALQAIHTVRLQGVAPASFDADLMAAISLTRASASQGPTTIIGIRNASGKVYRLVHAVGVAESLAVADRLERLGLVDDPNEFDKAREGCDSIFAVPAWHPSQADGQEL